MRKLLFALVVMTMGFAFGGGTPASAMTAGAVTGMSDIIKPNSSVEQVRCWWRYGRRYCNHWGGWHRHRYHRRHCWWRHGRRYCRY
jgi:hypothetical protein